MSGVPSGLFRNTDRDSLKIEGWQWRYTVSTPPATEPVTLAEAKLFAKVDLDADDALINALITNARITVEKETGRALITQTIDAALDFVPSASKLEFRPRPIQSVTYIKAVNEDGTDDDVSTADIILDGANGIFGIKSTASNVTSDSSFNAFQVRYVAGYGDAEDVPQWAKEVIMQLVAHWYKNRQSVKDNTMSLVPYSTQLLIDQNRIADL